MWIAPENSFDSKCGAFEKAPLFDAVKSICATRRDIFARMGKKRRYANFIYPNESLTDVFWNILYKNKDLFHNKRSVLSRTALRSAVTLSDFLSRIVCFPTIIIL